MNRLGSLRRIAMFASGCMAVFALGMALSPRAVEASCPSVDGFGWLKSSNIKYLITGSFNSAEATQISNAIPSAITHYAELVIMGVMSTTGLCRAEVNR